MTPTTGGRMRDPGSRSRPSGLGFSNLGFGGLGFGGRLLVTQALVLVAGAATTWVVAILLGPAIFHDHVEQSGTIHSAAEVRHVEEAFRDALLVSMGIALLAAATAALAVSWYLSRRVGRSIAPVSTAASEIASGQYAVRIADPGLGDEFALLSDNVNALAERLSAVERTRRSMLADLAHEMRTPLATIEAHLEAVEDGVRTLDADTLGVLRASTTRLGRLAEDIAAVSTAEETGVALDRRPASAAAVAEAVVTAAYDRFAAKEVDLCTDLDTDPVALLDPDRIAQVLSNLLDNALRHTPAGGAVTLRCATTASVLEYAVSDTGEGIDAVHLPHVFDRFYRADTARDRVRGGSGIGLSIARALVEAHGGTISVTSPGTGRGTTFTVRLPLDD